MNTLILLRNVIGFTLLGAMLSACGDYRLSVNDTILYTPEPPFSEYTIADEHLRQCVEQTIRDQVIPAASQLEELNCSHAGITDLVGLEVFAGLIRLKLSSNKISSISPLFDMQRLAELQLDGNELISLGGIYQMVNLTYLNVAGNDQLACSELENLKQRLTLKIDAPDHCA